MRSVIDAAVAVRAGAFACAVAAIISAAPALAHDENIYIGVQTGASFTSLRDIRDVGGSFESGTTATEPSLSNSAFYGAKLGIYPRSGVLGLEAEVFRSHPDPNNQTQTFFEPTFGPFQQTRGGEQDVTTTAINLIARVPISERVVAHVGAGPALVRARLKFDDEQSQTTNRVGVNTQFGLSYFVNPAVAVTVEWKFTGAELDFPTHGTTEGFTSDYRAHHIGVGVSYAFDWAGPIRAPFTIRGLLGLEPKNIGPQR